MVLIVDSNEFRREKSSRYLRYDGIPSLSIGYDDFEYYTKPLLTILVDPNKNFISNIKSTDETLYVIVAKTNRHMEFYKNIPLILSDNGTVETVQITKIINDYFRYDLKTDMIYRIKIFDDVCDIAHNGARLNLCEREYKIVKFFTYNQGKLFTLYEIFGYLGFNGKIKDETFSSYIMKINNKCKRAFRCKLIHKHASGYEMINEGVINPDLFNSIHNIINIQEE